MDKRIIDVGRSRIAFNMIGFGLIFGLGATLVLIFSFATGRSGGSGREAVTALVVLFVVAAAGLYFMGRCLGGIVFGIAEVVRGVNSDRTAVSGGVQNSTTNKHE